VDILEHVMSMKIPNSTLLEHAIIADLIRRKKEQPAQIPLPQPHPYDGCPACGGPLAVAENGIVCTCCGRGD
jgi:hypothetical protein